MPTLMGSCRVVGEISSRRWVWNPIRSKNTPYWFTRLKISDGLDASPPVIQVVCVSQNVVRLAKGAVRGEQRQLAVQIHRLFQA